MTKHRAAEKKVASFFSDEGCVANEPDEDIHGWDVFVEFPRPFHSGPAEEEPPHPKAYIQVKSTKGRGNSAPIKLSNVQIAVTSDDPWFIIRAYPDHTYRALLEATKPEPTVKRTKRTPSLPVGNYTDLVALRECKRKPSKS